MKIANNKFQKITIAIIFAWLIFFVLAPNLLVLAVSFLTRDSSNFYALPFTFENYTRLFEPLYAQVVWNSLYMSGIATIICLIIGYPFAFMISRIKEKYRPILLFLVVLPFWTNSLIRIYGMKIFLGVKGILNSTLLTLGIINEPIRILNTEVAVIIGLVYLLLPFMILPLYAAIEKLDHRLLEAAKDLGANSFQRFVKVIIPLTMPGIIAGCLLVLLPAMGMFYVADLLGGAKVLLVGNVIKSEFLISRNWPFGSAISIGLTILMALLIFVYYKASKLMNKKMELE
ncbi:MULTISPECIES: spermidine/putrescine ABC transporter permease PotB [Avibacterium]|uniref:Spermidine/putrescine ABC transporter permease PotB n=1 Tax=Avibacterium paragallinarum TaxID=728 RepID=A0AAE5TI27_AVIPA|nr:spermidine/putrescine ABC transporter permease PotB [Avibacterium paragallinarum]MEE3608897.1 spermidine/putrescine ABC transporter permease PotB [Avibacterium paragallinarum]MEE3621915.1 spermidine/putrescine ABC transporter permease PotB [Avibacterium paragallinarum]MEE3669083.1 spermidine/putrescine ABC transporter permease PotB [Avibacterium paragallinarum]MEE3680722.1 spermidine/putrescine ABC transporter permease PotB [Avibacterium paragallinarum]MEE4386078.1 spermidine/putrescine ABC